MTYTLAQIKRAINKAYDMEVAGYRNGYRGLLYREEAIEGVTQILMQPADYKPNFKNMKKATKKVAKKATKKVSKMK